MSREVKRVPLDFDWGPGSGVWLGYKLQHIACPEAPEWSRVSERYEPPVGEGWQMWETTSEGSPISPVFASPEDLATWLADTNASTFGSLTATASQWLKMIGCGSAPSLLIRDGTWQSGVAAVGEEEQT